MPPGGKASVVDAEALASHQGKDVATPPWPMNLALANAIVRPTTLGDTAIVAATDDVNRTPSPQTTSVDRRLKCFTERITKRRQSPLLEMIRPLADEHCPHSPSKPGG
jgi:hypothetical protein